MLKRTALLFTDLTARPGTAIGTLLSEDARSGPVLLLFAAYAAVSALVSRLMPAGFVPELPPETFGRPYALYLSVSLSAGLLLNVLAAAALPWAEAFFSAGRIGPRVLLAIAGLGVYFLSFAAAAGRPAAAALLAAAPAALFLGLLVRRPGFPVCFRIMLALSAPGLALAPVEFLGIAAGSKPVYEAAMLAAALWSLWLLTLALRARGCPGTA
ncbi:MAG TPA: hypothetical protein PK523_08495, partial [Elusimicrobiales bacterium]|nr:hypothetical protein [Elusimicrobiales bacterium]